MNASINFQCQAWNPYGLIIFGTISILKHMFSEHSSFQLHFYVNSAWFSDFHT